MFTRKKFKTQCGIIGARGMQHRLANTDPLIGPVQDRINEVLLSGENICRLSNYRHMKILSIDAAYFGKYKATVEYGCQYADSFSTSIA